jgi:hypothetical protein
MASGLVCTLREHVRAGKSVRRARVVSEPLSDYQRWPYSIAGPMVAAGEDIRWVPRKLMYARMFEHLQTAASYGPAARALVIKALDELRPRRDHEPHSA